MQSELLPRAMACAVLATVTSVAAVHAAPIVITPTFNSSITTDPNSAAIIAGINNAITEVQSKVSTSTATPLSVSIDFTTMSDGLGQSDTNYDTLSYSAFRAAVASRATSANDMTALAHLPNTASFNGISNVIATRPLWRALGFSNEISPGADSTISLNTGLMNFSRTGPQNPDNYDLQTVVMHEISEVLGVGGGGSNLGSSDQATTMGSLDVFRYSAPGVSSYTTSSSANAYFSIDGGTTNIRGFNQDGQGDYADWLSTATPYVQDAFGTPGTYSDLAAPELTAYDVVGYTVVPEPMACSLIGLGAIGVLRRRRARVG